MANPIVRHDGACSLGRCEIALTRQLDRRGAIRMVDVAAASETVCPIDPGALLVRFHASEEGRLLSGAAGFASMSRAIPVLRLLDQATRRPLIPALFERASLAFLSILPNLQRHFMRRWPA